jgi:mannitol/fructose-specific phosphotransferase system IIA component (Ntr-type)
VQATTVDDAIFEIGTALALAHDLDPQHVVDSLRRREGLGTTALGAGLALPHGRADIPKSVGALGISPLGIDWDAPDGLPVHVVVALLSPVEGSQHLAALARVAAALSNATLCAQLLAASDAKDVHRLLLASEATM